MFRYRTSTHYYDVELQGENNVIDSLKCIALLGDELFATRNGFETNARNIVRIHVWNVARSPLLLQPVERYEAAYSRCIQIADLVMPPDTGDVELNTMQVMEALDHDFQTNGLITFFYFAFCVSRL